MSQPGVNKFVQQLIEAGATKEEAEEAADKIVGGAKRSKYGNTKVEIDGFKFDSKREAARWVELRTMWRAGVITELERQVPYRLEVNGVLIATYKADFRYRAQMVVVEDSKGVATAVYRLKKKLMFACHGVKIKEV